MCYCLYRLAKSEVSLFYVVLCVSRPCLNENPAHGELSVKMGITFIKLLHAKQRPQLAQSMRRHPQTPITYYSV